MTIPSATHLLHKNTHKGYFGKPKTSSSVPTGNGMYLMDPNLQEQPSTASFSGSNDVKHQIPVLKSGLFPGFFTPLWSLLMMTTAPHVKGEFISLKKVQDWTRVLSFLGFTTGKSSSTLGWNDEKENIQLKHCKYSNYNQSVPKRNI